jgi:hypothetical protein
MPTTTTFLFCAVVAIMLIYALIIEYLQNSGISGFRGGFGSVVQTERPRSTSSGKGTIQRWACCTFDNRTP